MFVGKRPKIKEEEAGVFPFKKVFKKLFYIKPHYHPNGFYWGHQCSWTLTPANSMQVSIMQFDNCNRK